VRFARETPHFVCSSVPFVSRSLDGFPQFPYCEDAQGGHSAVWLAGRIKSVHHDRGDCHPRASATILPKWLPLLAMRSDTRLRCQGQDFATKRDDSDKRDSIGLFG
jgi:hypothetical protein